MKLLLLATILAVCTVLASSQITRPGPDRPDTIVVDVPGYAKVTGNVGESVKTKRPYYAFRGLHYAEEPSAEGRFLVLLNRSFFNKKKF